MTRTILLLATLFAGSLLNAATVAERLQGHWEAEVTGDGKTFSFLFDFKASGDKLAGTVELSVQDRSFEIKDGKINGDNISFTAFGIWTGRLEGNDLKLTRGLDFGKKQYMTAHRTKGN